VDRRDEQRHQAFEALSAAADVLRLRPGVRAVLLADERGEPVLTRGDVQATLLAAAPRLLRTAIGALGRTPVLIRDDRVRVLVREVVSGLWLLVELDAGRPAGLSDRLTRPTAETMARVLGPLLAAAGKDGA
jgi:hypothetical protein